MREEKAALSSRAAVLSLSLSLVASVDGKKDAGRSDVGGWRGGGERVAPFVEGKAGTRRTRGGDGCRRLSLDGERWLGRG